MANKLLMGNEAFAHAALEAGCGVFAGYPGTPSSELIETVAKLVAQGNAEGVHVEWSTNEKAALELALGASLCGVRSLMTCKQVGLNVASDALMSLNYLGVVGGLVIFVADDPGPISSQTEQDTRRFASFAKVPVLDPATPEQGADMIRQAFELSETYKTPVIVRPTTRVDHSSTFFEVEDHTKALLENAQGFKRDPSKWVIFPRRAYESHIDITRRLNSIAHDFAFDPDYARFNPMFENDGVALGAVDVISTNELTGEDVPKLGIITGGITTQYALEALDVLRAEAARMQVQLPLFRFMQVGTPYPFPKRAGSAFLKNLSDVLVLEELDSVIEEELLKVAGNSFLSPRIHGRLTGEANEAGENGVEIALLRIAAFFDKYSKNHVGSPYSQMSSQMSSQMQGAQVMNAQAANPQMANAQAANPQMQSMPTFMQMADHLTNPSQMLQFCKPLPARPAVLCAGCPHRGSFYAVKTALSKLKISRDDAIFCGDIGCYTLGNAHPLDAVDTCLCMGADITMAQGISVADSSKKAIAFIGDSTFFASGMTGVANAVYNNHDITVCVLDNSTTAMTGSQPHPGIGVRLMGGKSEPISIEAVLSSLGVSLIEHADPLDHEQSEEACKRALEFEGPSAVIFESPCVWLQPFGIAAKVDTSICTGCKKCVTEIGCPAIGFNPLASGPKSGSRGQAVIDRSQCNGCELCIGVCPFSAIHIVDEPDPELEPLSEPAPVIRQSRLNRGGVPAGEYPAQAGSARRKASWGVPRSKQQEGVETAIRGRYAEPLPNQVMQTQAISHGSSQPAQSLQEIQQAEQMRSTQMQSPEGIGDNESPIENVFEPVDEETMAQETLTSREMSHETDITSGFDSYADDDPYYEMRASKPSRVSAKEALGELTHQMSKSTYKYSMKSRGSKQAVKTKFDQRSTLKLGQDEEQKTQRLPEQQEFLQKQGSSQKLQQVHEDRSQPEPKSGSEPEPKSGSAAELGSVSGSGTDTLDALLFGAISDGIYIPMGNEPEDGFDDGLDDFDEFDGDDI